MEAICAHYFYSLIHSFSDPSFGSFSMPGMCWTLLCLSLACSVMVDTLQLEEFRKGRLEENSKELSGPFSRSIRSSLFFSEDYGCPSHFFNLIAFSLFYILS